MNTTKNCSNCRFDQKQTDQKSCQINSRHRRLFGLGCTQHKTASHGMENPNQRQSETEYTSNKKTHEDLPEYAYMDRMHTLSLIGKDPAAIAEARDLKQKGCGACQRHIERMGLVTCGDGRKRPRRVTECSGFLL